MKKATELGGLEQTLGEAVLGFQGLDASVQSALGACGFVTAVNAFVHHGVDNRCGRFESFSCTFIVAFFDLRQDFLSVRTYSGSQAHVVGSALDLLPGSLFCRRVICHWFDPRS